MIFKLAIETLKEIFIINNAGVGLFYQNFETNRKDDKDIVSAFLKIFQDLSIEYLNQSLQEFQVGTNKMVFFSDEPVSFVIKVNSTLPSKKIEGRIKFLKDLFVQTYTQQIERNETEISFFDDFEEEIKKVFDIKIKTKRRSSELLQDFFGISIKRANLKKLIGSL